MTRRCYAEISLDALTHNAAVLSRGVELMAVVKANAYGHGAALVARALEGKVSLLGVANLREAMELKEAGVKTPILLLGACLPEEREEALRAGFQVTLSSLEEAAVWSELASRLGVEGQGHAVVDTGMGRMGFTEAQWNVETVARLFDLPHMQWEGLCSHLPSADEDEAFTQEQIERFHLCVQTGWDGGFLPRWVHFVNSAGILGHPEVSEFCHLARAGLALYGVSPLPEKQDLLKRALTWKTRVLLVRELPAGHGVSYGRTKILERATKVATLGCGYADGYMRQISGKDATVLIHGRRCPLLGRVTMDQIMVDVTDVPDDVQAGDEAVLLGTQGTETITAEELATLAGTIPWHVFTSISARVERVTV